MGGATAPPAPPPPTAMGMENKMGPGLRKYDNTFLAAVCASLNLKKIDSKVVKIS